MVAKAYAFQNKSVRELEKKVGFDKHIARGIRERSGLSVGELVDEIKGNYPLDRVSLCNRIYRIENGGVKPKFRIPGDFNSDYLTWLMNTAGYNPCGIRPRLLQQKERRGSQGAA